MVSWIVKTSLAACAAATFVNAVPTNGQLRGKSMPKRQLLPDPDSIIDIFGSLLTGDTGPLFDYLNDHGFKVPNSTAVAGNPNSADVQSGVKAMSEFNVTKLIDGALAIANHDVLAPIEFLNLTDIGIVGKLINDTRALLPLDTFNITKVSQAVDTFHRPQLLKPVSTINLASLVETSETLHDESALTPLLTLNASDIFHKLMNFNISIYPLFNKNDIQTLSSFAESTHNLELQQVAKDMRALNY